MPPGGVRAWTRWPRHRDIFKLVSGGERAFVGEGDDVLIGQALENCTPFARPERFPKGLS